jgi:hypothetical protein
MGPLITKVLAFLETLDDLDLTVTDDSITVKETSKTGYTVTLWEDQTQTYVVNYGHYWHDHYSSEDKAVEWFMSGISGRFRLVCTYRWRYMVQCTVERSSDGDWIRADTVGSCLSFFVWWLPKREEYLQNKLVLATEVEYPIGF